MKREINEITILLLQTFSKISSEMYRCWRNFTTTSRVTAEYNYHSTVKKNGEKNLKRIFYRGYIS